MRYRNVIIALGFLVFVLQMLGFPQSWDDVFYLAIGLLIMIFAYLSAKADRKETIERTENTSSTGSSLDGSSKSEANA